jgi:hypothetical protein
MVGLFEVEKDQVRFLTTQILRVSIHTIFVSPIRNKMMIDA